MRQNSGKVVTSIHFLSYTATKHTKRKLKTRILNIIKDKTRMNLEHENYIRKVKYIPFQSCLLTELFQAKFYVCPVGKFLYAAAQFGSRDIIGQLSAWLYFAE